MSMYSGKDTKGKASLVKTFRSSAMLKTAPLNCELNAT
jgi:hypothetical protein